MANFKNTTIQLNRPKIAVTVGAALVNNLISDVKKEN